MNCPRCHQPLPADAAFCPACGKSGSAAAEPPPAPRTARTLSNLETVAPIAADHRSELPPGTRFADRYEVIRTIGQGGMGIAYLARDTNTGQEVVLKLIHPELVTGDEAVKRLLAEGLIARQIRHPNVVAVYDVAQWDGQPYFTMEFVSGGTLRSWLVGRIGSHRDVPFETATGLMKSMLAGIGEAHRMGVVHRDLKPENVLLSGDPDAGNFDLKILDFGIAKAVKSQSSWRGGAIGTVPYMAPEQATSADAVGPAADLYSLSVMFYELLMEAAPQSRWEPVSKNRPDVPPAIDELIEKGLSARPRSRHASVADFQSALDRATRGTRPVPDPVPRPPLPPDPQFPPNPVRPDHLKSNWWAKLPKKTQMWVGGAGVLVTLGVIGLMNPEPAQPSFHATGTWRVNANSGVLQVKHNGRTFVGEGFMSGFGDVAIDGTLSEGGGASFEIVNGTTDQPIGVGGTGQVVDGNGPGDKDINFSFMSTNGAPISGTWHINH